MYLMEGPPGARVVVNGKEVDYFCGTGYFGLQGHPELVRAACNSVQKYGIGSATSRFGYGDNPVLLEVEERAATFFGTERALYYVSGYLGNAILLQGLCEKYDTIFIDEASHYSVLDGAYTARKPVIRFNHLDSEDLRMKILKGIKPSQRLLLICDGVFPISGEISPMPEYLKVLEDFDRSIICIDDAHGTGVLGENGRGTFEHFGLVGDGLYASFTLSKALGGHGGIITGDREFIEHLQKTSTIFHGSSAVPTPAAAAAAKALEILLEKPELRRKLWENVSYAKRALRDLGFDIPETPVPIICLHREDLDLQALQLRLFEKGIAVLYTAGGSYSGVPENGAIRIAIFSTHSKEQIDRLVSGIRDFID
jgi:8-amino-7-oxononanoate synthase